MEVFDLTKYHFIFDLWHFTIAGLTLLLPVIINRRSNWSETKLRIFCTASGVHELENEQKGYESNFYLRKDCLIK